MLCQSVYLAEALTNRLVETAGSYIHVLMSRTFQILQLNVGKQEMVQLSLLNDDSLCHGDTEAQYVDRSIQCEDENLRLKREGECERSRVLILDPANPRCASECKQGKHPM